MNRRVGGTLGSGNLLVCGLLSRLCRLPLGFRLTLQARHSLVKRLLRLLRCPLGFIGREGAVSLQLCDLLQCILIPQGCLESGVTELGSSRRGPADFVVELRCGEQRLRQVEFRSDWRLDLVLDAKEVFGNRQQATYRSTNSIGNRLERGRHAAKD